MNYVAVVNFACENMPNRVRMESNAAMCLTRMCLHIMLCVYIVVRFVLHTDGEMQRACSFEKDRSAFLNQIIQDQQQFYCLLSDLSPSGNSFLDVCLTPACIFIHLSDSLLWEISSQLSLEGELSVNICRSRESLKQQVVFSFHYLKITKWHFLMAG